MEMPTVNYTLRIDEADKRDTETIFKELGMTFATGTNVYLKAVKRQNKIPFELAIGGQPDITTRSKVKASREEKHQAFMALDGVLAGHEVDLDDARAERILS